MLIIDDKSVYEIDEECLKRRKVPPACQTYEKVQKEQNKEEENHSTSSKRGTAR